MRSPSWKTGTVKLKGRHTQWRLVLNVCSYGWVLQNEHTPNTNLILTFVSKFFDTIDNFICIKIHPSSFPPFQIIVDLKFFLCQFFLSLTKISGKCTNIVTNYSHQGQTTEVFPGPGTRCFLPLGRCSSYPFASSAFIRYRILPGRLEWRVLSAQQTHIYLSLAHCINSIPLLPCLINFFATIPSASCPHHYGFLDRVLVLIFRLHLMVRTLGSPKPFNLLVET